MTRFTTEAEILEAIDANQKELAFAMAVADRLEDEHGDDQDRVKELQARAQQLKDALSAFRTQTFPFAAGDPSVVV